MRSLKRHAPTPQQLGIIGRIRSGVTVIRGAAGSGKTSTALFSLRATTAATVNQLQVEGELPARVLVLTYNKSLRGYIAAVAEEELSDLENEVDLEINNFDRWAKSLVGQLNLDLVRTRNFLTRRVLALPRPSAFLLDECEYVLGRFPHDDLALYLDAERTGRGARPQMDRAIRDRLLTEVLEPYQEYKRDQGLNDFHDLAIAAQAIDDPVPYDVIVVDEAQDLSANQLRVVSRHIAPTTIATFVTDTAQRIYPRGTSWLEAGIKVNRSFVLDRNYRNTVEIASLAAAIAGGLPIDEEGILPDPARCLRRGPQPIYIRGTFPQQTDYALEKLQELDLTDTTVGFLHLKGGGWFDFLKQRLDAAGIGYCDLQGKREWPDDGPNVGLCTLHSAKGLEFDHVLMLGLTSQVVSYGEELDDDRQESFRRLLAMAIGRARDTVTLGSKLSEELDIVARVPDNILRVIDL